MSVAAAVRACSIVMCTALMTAACGPIKQGPSAPVATSAPGQGQPVLQSVAPGPLPTPLPSAMLREASTPDPSFDFGFVVQITPTGMHPHWLVSPCCSDIVWLNLTNRSMTVALDALGVRSAAIPPGGAYLYAPGHAESISFHALNYPVLAGVVQVNQTVEP